MSPQVNDLKRKTEDDFQECEDVLHQLEKNELVALLKSCWESKNKGVQSLIRNVVLKKQKKDEEKRKQSEKYKIIIFETNWVFPDPPVDNPQPRWKRTDRELGSRRSQGRKQGLVFIVDVQWMLILKKWIGMIQRESLKSQ